MILSAYERANKTEGLLEELLMQEVHVDRKCTGISKRFLVQLKLGLRITRKENTNLHFTDALDGDELLAGRVRHGLAQQELVRTAAPPPGQHWWQPPSQLQKSQTCEPETL